MVPKLSMKKWIIAWSVPKSGENKVAKGMEVRKCEDR